MWLRDLELRVWGDGVQTSGVLTGHPGSLLRRTLSVAHSRNSDSTGLGLGPGKFFGTSSGSSADVLRPHVKEMLV